MNFYGLTGGYYPRIEVTGRLYNQGVFGVSHAPPEPGVGYGRVERQGSKWHDCLDTTMSHYGVYALHERVAEGIAAEGLTGLELYELVFERSENKRLPLESAPKYYWTLFTGRVPAKVYSAQGELYPFDEATGLYQRRFESYTSYHIEVDRWDGSDFFALSTVENGMRFVSERVVEAARKHRWTNFGFQPLKDGHIFDLRVCGPTMEYLPKGKR